MEKTNFEALIYGVQHIAKNHNFKSLIKNGQITICGNNIPTLMDIKMLCEDVHYPIDNISSNQYCICFYVSNTWIETIGQDIFDGNCFWEKIIL